MAEAVAPRFETADFEVVIDEHFDRATDIELQLDQPLQLAEFTSDLTSDPIDQAPNNFSITDPVESSLASFDNPTSFALVDEVFAQFGFDDLALA